jgi:hypothetical protein
VGDQDAFARSRHLQIVVPSIVGIALAAVGVRYYRRRAAAAKSAASPRPITGFDAAIEYVKDYSPKGYSPSLASSTRSTTDSLDAMA